VGYVGGGFGGNQLAIQVVAVMVASSGCVQSPAGLSFVCCGINNITSFLFVHKVQNKEQFCCVLTIQSRFTSTHLLQHNCDVSPNDYVWYCH
jgi:hypothetical protein